MTAWLRGLSALAALALPAASSGLDADSLRCLCADGALTHGDYVSCVAHLSRRLVATGVLDGAGRAAILTEAARSRVPEEPLPMDCAKGTGWGMAVQTDHPIYRQGDTARVEGLIWNFSAQDVHGMGPLGPGPPADPDTCLILLTLRGIWGQVVHRQEVLCAYTLVPYPLEAGRVRRLAADLPLVHRKSEVGLPDGTPLDPGEYFAVAEIGAGYPNHTDVPGGLPGFASFSFEVTP